MTDTLKIDEKIAAKANVGLITWTTEKSDYRDQALEALERLTRQGWQISGFTSVKNGREIVHTVLVVRR